MKKNNFNWDLLIAIAACVSLWFWIAILFAEFKVFFANFLGFFIMFILQKANTKNWRIYRLRNRIKYALKFFVVTIFISTIIQLFFNINIVNAIIFSTIMHIFSTVANEIYYIIKD